MENGRVCQPVYITIRFEQKCACTWELKSNQNAKPQSV